MSIPVLAGHDARCMVGIITHDSITNLARTPTISYPYMPDALVRREKYHRMNPSPGDKIHDAQCLMRT